MPQLGVSNVFTASSAAPWIAAADDQDPTITVRWRGMRTVRTLTLLGAPGEATMPGSVVVAGRSGSQLLRVGSGGTVTLSRPVRTDLLSLSFPSLTNQLQTGAAGQPSQLPIGLASVTIPALRGLHVAAPSPAASFRLACGKGPSVTVDGHAYQTSVSGNVGDLLQLRPVQLHLCAPGGALSLPGGRHRLVVGSAGIFSLTNMALSSPGARGAQGARGSLSPARTAAAAPRSVGVLSWQPDSRAVRIGPGAATYVEVHENFNDGWVATLNGKRLTPAVLDGWQQAFIVPAGAGGVITLSYAPALVYHAGLIASAVLLAGMVLLAARRRRTGAPAAAPGGTGRPRSAAAARIAPWLALAALAVVMIVTGGAAVIVVPVLVIVWALRTDWLPRIAALAMAAAGVIAAATSQPDALGSGAFSRAAQACALLALAAALMPSRRPSAQPAARETR
jgi:arabinofuranan 3-O-arabinosyltransferase